MSFTINCIAVIGKTNEPLWIKNFTTHDDLKFHYIAHTSLDLIEERIGASKHHTDLYLGMLYAMEDFAVFGYMTNTKCKLVLVVDVHSSVIIKDVEMKEKFRHIHNAYVDLVCNPFYEPDKLPIKSTMFEQTLAKLA